MTLGAVWLIPLGVGAAGAAGLVLLAGRLRRQVEQVHQSMRPLRVEHHRRPPG